MKTVKRRAGAALVIAALIIAGMALYIFRFAVHGGEWASFGGNSSVYSGGQLAVGTVTDRNGVVLAHADANGRGYAESSLTRAACLHAVGDYSGNIGSGALTAFADALVGYDPVGGLSDGGGEVTLSIDSRLNEAAYSALNGRSGAVMIMNYKTGEILCMVSAPAYDPETGFDASNPAYEGVYINRCIGASFAPGSVFKLVTLAAAIENIPDLFERSFNCSGSVQVGNGVVTCTGVRGAQTIEQALANSCNCAFAELSLELNGSTLAKYAELTGMTSKLTLDKIAVNPGSFDADDGKTVNTAWSGIGQYHDLVTPYSMLRYSAAIASGGLVTEPTLLLGEGGKTTRVLSEDTASRIAEMMSYNVKYAYGEWSFPNLPLCGKSGTAEVGDGTSHAWFTGFLNDEEHPYAFVAVIEHGGGGLANAGALINTVLQTAVTLE